MAAPRYGRPNVDYVRTWFEREDDAPMWALNLMRYRTVASYADGRDDAVTGQEADDRYAPIAPLARVGAFPVVQGRVVDQPIGGEPRWDRVAIARYPRRRAMLDMQQDPEFVERHEHKDAGMESTIVLATFPRPDQPVPAPELTALAPDRHHLLQVVTDADAPDLAVGLGGERLGVFDVEGWILGDGRSFAEARWDVVPTAAAAELAADLGAGAVAGHEGSIVVVLEPEFDHIAAALNGWSPLESSSPAVTA
jgi:hypothetical protein